jgi:hypothetical protein
MSGGSHDYQYYHLEEYIDSMKKYDAELASLLEDVRTLCHDLEWYESGDYGLDTWQESMEGFKQKWYKATPAMQERVKKTLLDYCDQIDKYCLQLRKVAK